MARAADSWHRRRLAAAAAILLGTNAPCWPVKPASSFQKLTHCSLTRYLIAIALLILWFALFVRKVRAPVQKAVMTDLSARRGMIIEVPEWRIVLGLLSGRWCGTSTGNSAWMPS